LTTVFIGGSRRISRLSDEVLRRIDSIIDKGLQVIVGDANGADKAVQKYLESKGYSRVEVFCTNGQCRNNMGNWPLHEVRTERRGRSFAFRTAKDREMSSLASVGFMIWDGHSLGTVLNMQRLVRQGKKAVVYVSPTKQFVNVEGVEEVMGLVVEHSPELVPRLEREVQFEQQNAWSPRQSSLI
jgi:hypothetical protein